MGRNPQPIRVPNVLKTLEKILTLEGYLVTGASEGKSA